MFPKKEEKSLKSFYEANKALLFKPKDKIKKENLRLYS